MQKGQERGEKAKIHTVHQPSPCFICYYNMLFSNYIKTFSKDNVGN